MAIPGSTYRLQFNSRFGFREAAAIVPYLHALGITHCYASPLFQARAGSTHGYDVCSFERLSPELGSAEDFQSLLAALREQKMGLLLDIVPNHMGNDLSNEWWRDVLEWGPQSRFACFFDIEWQPLKSDLSNKVLLPVLEDHIRTVLESAKLQLHFANGGFSIAHYDRHFPVAPRSYPTILMAILESFGQKQIERGLAERIREMSIGFRQFSTKADYERISQLKAQLQKLHNESESLRSALESALREFNGVPGHAVTFDRLFGLLQEQNYRLAFWRVAAEEINYRRFFDVTELVSLKMELPEVFEATHCLVLELLAQGNVDGLRVDHPDGLLDPKAYFDRLQESYARVRATDPTDAAQVSGRRPLYIVAEKILTDDEPLPEDWAIHGTTGYEFLNRVNSVFVESNNEAQFNHIYHEFICKDKGFPAIIYAGKKRMVEKSFISEVNALAHRLKAIAVQSRVSQDFTFSQLRRALSEVIVCFPVYRTYLTEQTRPVPQLQQQWIEHAIQQAGEHASDLDQAVFDFVGSILSLNFPRDLYDKGRGDCRQFIFKFQQLTGPAMAKGLEDTAFYRYNRLISLNEVGGNPGKFGVTVEQFHAFNRSRAESWPHSLLATATHDTKRGEDVRARINVLSEMPTEWHKAIQTWRALNAPLKQFVSGKPAPDANDEYLLYQTLVGAWPEAGHLDTFRERISAYMLKAMREAKQNTSWIDPSAEYESATRHFVEAIFAASNKEFLDQFLPFQAKIAFFGRLNSLSQLLLKITSPGVPDFYQGTELWDLNLVDPDNRRSVDYSLREQLLKELSHKKPDEASDLRRLEGSAKLFVIHRVLQFRNAHRGLFDHGDYVPLAVEGSKSRYLCAFARTTKSEMVVVAVPRLSYSLMRGQTRLPVGAEVWEDTSIILPGKGTGTVERVFGGTSIVSKQEGGLKCLPARELFSDLPVALVKWTPGPTQSPSDSYSRAEADSVPR